jgi:ADP-heptose:LPS heptosyltransferase
MVSRPPARILVIKHGALGDICLAFPAFAAIRAAHEAAAITLLTTAPYAAFLAAAPWFDHMIVDQRPSFWNMPGILRLRHRLRDFDFVYDLQTSQRSSLYRHLTGRPRPDWSGIARGASHPHADPARDRLHTRERLQGQLRDAGIAALAAPDLTWLTQADIARFDLPAAFTLLVPGAAAHRPAKRWPHFGRLAPVLGEPVVVVGAAGEGVGQGIDLTGLTSLGELAAIIGRARRAIGNDTGPMHLAAALGVPSVVLFSAASDPAVTAPRMPDGGWPGILRAADLSDLTVAQVLAALP